MATDPLILTFSSSTDAHTAGDVVAAPEELVNFSREAGRGVLIESIVVIDESDTGAALDLVFLDASGSIGAESAAFTMTDAVALTCIGIVPITASDYKDAVDNKVATVMNIGMLMHPTNAATSVWVGLVARGSITPAAVDDITIKIGRVYA